jgi:hemoglobin
MDLLARLGGPAALGRVTDALYERLLADREIGPLLAATHMPAQRERFTAYLVAASRGDEGIPVERLRVAHYGQGVTDRHFSIMAGHLADVLAALGIDAEAAADLLDLIAARRADIVSGSLVAESWDPIDPTV